MIDTVDNLGRTTHSEMLADALLSTIDENKKLWSELQECKKSNKILTIRFRTANKHLAYCTWRLKLEILRSRYYKQQRSEQS